MTIREDKRIILVIIKMKKLIISSIIPYTQECGLARRWVLIVFLFYVRS